MHPRKYYIVADGSVIKAREKAIRSISLSSCGDIISFLKSNYFFEVTKSRRAPEYIVHCQKTKADRIQMIKHRPRLVRRPLDQGTSSNCTQPSEDEGNLEPETTDQEDNMVGLRVIACNKQDGLYYPGHVSHTPQSSYAVVKFSNQKCQKVRTQMIIPMSGAVPRPELAPGDFVLVQVFNQSKQLECFVPGIVEVIPEDSRHHAKFYSVLLYNGQRETTLRKFIVKIGKARFEMAIRYIVHIQQQKLLRQEGTLSDNSTLMSPQSAKRSDDDVSSTKSSQSGSGRRKKEKITKKIGKSVEKEKHSRSSRRKNRSRSRSESSRSSRSQSRSSSRSPAPKSRSKPQRSRSKSEKYESRSDSSRSRSRSGSESSRSPAERSRSKLDSSRSRSTSRSSRSSKSSMSSRSSRSSKNSSMRSRSRSSSSSTTIRSRSSVQMSRSKSAAGRRSRSSSKSSRSRSRSRSKESKGSSTPRAQSPYERPHRPTPTARPRTPPIRTESMLETADVTRRDIYNERSYSATTSKYGNIDEKDELVQALQNQVEKQKRKQLRQEMRLVRQARKINKIQRKLHTSDISHNESRHSSRTDRSDRFKSPRSSSSETDTSLQKRKGSPDGTSYKESSYLQRKSSSELKMNQVVLARWQDDGWYYNGCVVVETSNQKYSVRDSTGYTEIISRDDILTENEHRFDAIQPEDHVIGLHPKYAYSFAPAEVLGTYSNNSVKVEFFDGNIAELMQNDVYRISKEKYDQVVEYIKRCEKHLIGHSVVARDDTTGQYKLGIVDSRVGLGQQYYIKWLDGDMTKQNDNHIFDVARRQTRHDDWSHVLAPTGQQSMVYMPAEVIQSNPLVVQFCDGKRSSSTTIDQCFWLSKEYYDNARGYFINVKNSRLRNNIA